MASTSTATTPSFPLIHSTDPSDIDLVTSMLMVQLTISDINDITSSRKGKSRADFPLSDEEIAFNIQKELFQEAMRETEDHIMAKSASAALETDLPYLRAMAVMEQAAADDRAAALALHNGGALPQRSRHQILVENRAFAVSLEPAVAAVRPSTVELPSALNGVEAPKQLSTANRSSPLSQESQIVKTGASSRDPQERLYRTSCGDAIPKGAPSLRGPCNHDYCRACITDLVDACTRDESLFPPRCCNTPFPYSSLVRFLTLRLRAIFDSKRLELEVPAAHRIYCPTPTCSAFLGSSEATTRGEVICTACALPVCSACKQFAHPGKNCPESKETLEFREFAQRERWQTCPGCKAVVELSVGCYHMTCRCRTQFCYLCAMPWKNCQCPQWDEARLLTTAQQRVQQGIRGGAQAQPALFRAHVQEMVNTLRDNHNCVRHLWRRRNGRARCEECHFMLAEYLLVCSNCALAACVRCARNRLA